MVNGRWCRRPRYVHRIAFALLVLTRLVFSQRCRTDSFRVVTRIARCAIHLASSPTHSDSVAIALALPAAFDASRHSSLASMASWPVISMLRIRFDDARVSIAPGAFPIAFAAMDNLCAVPIDLDAARLHLQVQAPSWVSMLTWCVCSIDALVSGLPRTFLDIVDTTWYGCFAARLVWLVSRSTW